MLAQASGRRRRGGEAARAFLAAGALLLLLPLATAAQEETPAAEREEGERAVRVYLDCERWLCDFDHVRRELPFVAWVRDREVAEVHVLVTDEDTGGGGDVFTVDFIGRERFEGEERRLTYTSGPTETEAEQREGLTRVMTLGLVGYAAGTPAAEGLRIAWEGEPAGPDRTGGEPSRDPWDRWVFDVDLGGSADGEARRTSASFDGGISANRTTAEWKLDFGVGGRYSRQRFDVGDGEEFVSLQRRAGVEGLVVRSLGDHWSTGGRASVGHTTRLNQDLYVEVGPAVEFNVFPYAESTRRQLTLLYVVSGARYDYETATIFEETTELRSSQTLDVSLDLQETWGEARFSVEGSHFLREPQLNRLTVSGNLEFQLTRGLSLDLFGRASRIRDQIYLPAEEATEEQILVGEREFATDFETSVRIGLSYTFGSIFSDVVNPRFGNIGGRF